MERVCCGILEKLCETYKLPFYQPWVLNDGERDLSKMSKGSWRAKLFILTPDGEISEKPAPFIELTFCPFCGVRLVAEVEKGDNDAQSSEGVAHRQESRWPSP